MGEGKLNYHHKITITGVSGSGKDTLAKEICKIYSVNLTDVRVSNSKAIKDIARVILGVPSIDFDSQEVKRSSLEELGYSHIAKSFNCSTMREFLISIGDGFREKYDANVWAEITNSEMSKLIQFIKTDDRYPQEMQGSWDNKALHIHLINQSALKKAIKNGAIARSSEEWAACKFPCIADFIYEYSGKDIVEISEIAKSIKEILETQTSQEVYQKAVDWRKEQFDNCVMNLVEKSKEISNGLVSFQLTPTVTVYCRNK